MAVLTSISEGIHSTIKYHHGGHLVSGALRSQLPKLCAEIRWTVSKDANVRRSDFGEVNVLVRPFQPKRGARSRCIVVLAKLCMSRQFLTCHKNAVNVRVLSTWLYVMFL